MNTGEIVENKIKVRIEKEVNFSAGHRIPSHPKCGRLHGHNYRVIVAVEGYLDREGNGMLVDFGDIKKIVMTLDHRFLLGEKDSKLWTALEDERQQVYQLSVPHATAEWIAHWIAHKVGEINNNITHVTVELWETPDSKVVVEADYKWSWQVEQPLTATLSFPTYISTTNGEVRIK